MGLHKATLDSHVGSCVPDLEFCVSHSSRMYCSARGRLDSTVSQEVTSGQPGSLGSPPSSTSPRCGGGTGPVLCWQRPARPAAQTQRVGAILGFAASLQCPECGAFSLKSVSHQSASPISPRTSPSPSPCRLFPGCPSSPPQGSLPPLLLTSLFPT